MPCTQWQQLLMVLIAATAKLIYYLRLSGEINCNQVANQHHVYAHKLRSLNTWAHARHIQLETTLRMGQFACTITVPRVEVLGYMRRGLIFAFYDPAGSA